MTDEEYLKLAIQIGFLNQDKFRGKHIGAILVKDDRIISIGFRAMLPAYSGYKYCCVHAEFLALKSIEKLDISGVTLYCSLEPCTYRLVNDSRLFPSKPCTDYIIESGKVNKVIFAQKDEWLKISGTSILEANGVICQHIPIEVPKIEEKMPEEFREMIEPFLGVKI